MNHQNYQIRTLSPEETLTIYRDIAPAHFPDDELKPLSAIELLYQLNAYFALGLFKVSDEEPFSAPHGQFRAASEQLLGYALFLTPPGLDTVLLDYYAILEEYRDLGLGSFFLQGIKEFVKDRTGILIETEDPAYAENEEERLLRDRRNAFYYKNGAHRTNVTCTLFGVPFQIQFLPTGAPNSPQQLFPAEENSVQNTTASFIRKNLEATYRFMLSDEIYDRNVMW